MEELEEALPAARLYVMYGQTEATARLSCIDPEVRKHHPGSIGQGLDRVELKVLDDEGKPVSPGDVGEIVATGPNITLGYWQDPESTRRVYEGGLHTGDLATVDEDGFVIIVDRARDFLKCGGKRVGAKQIEEKILHYPGLSEVAVVGMPDMVLGEAVCLFVVHREGEAVSEDLKAFCEKALDHTLLPKRIIFRQDMPRNSSGKLDKRALRDSLEGQDDSHE